MQFVYWLRINILRFKVDSDKLDSDIPKKGIYFKNE